MSRRLTELGREKRLDEIPGDGWSYGPATHTKNIHVIILDALPGREMIMNQASAGTLDLVGTYRRPNAAAADREAAIHFPRYHRSREWNDKVGIVVVGAQRVSAEINDFMAGSAELSNQLLLQTKSAVVGGNSYAHSCLLS